MKSALLRDFSRPLGGGRESDEGPHLPGCTYEEISTWQLELLSRALGLPEKSVLENLALQRALFEPWGADAVPANPSYPSSIGDDHSPYEYSLAFTGNAVELRILFESQGKEPTAAAIQAAALETNQRLKQRFGVDLTRFDAVSDLFLPEQAAPPFSLWHAVCLNAGRAPEFKLYLNPQARGKADAPALVKEALGRLGFSRSARDMFAAVALRGPDLDEVRYFSLDMSARSSARVKVYFAHHGVTAQELERAFRFAPSHVTGDAESYLQTMAGQTGPFQAKPITTCFAFTAERDTPSAVTMHYPIAHYEFDDECIARRISKYLAGVGVSPVTYRRALAALARRPLDDGVGLQSYASFRREGGDERLTVYLSPELFRGATLHSGTRIAS